MMPKSPRASGLRRAHVYFPSRLYPSVGIGLTIALILSFAVFYVMFRLFKSLSMLALHGVLGLAVFWLFNYIGLLQIPINWITFLISAFGGVVGVLIVIALSFLHVPL